MAAGDPSTGRSRFASDPAPLPRRSVQPGSGAPVADIPEPRCFSRQTFLQLVLLSVIIVGQNITSRASDNRAEMTYKDAEATFYEAQQIQDHLQAQDDAISSILDKLLKLEAARTQA